MRRMHPNVHTSDGSDGSCDAVYSVDIAGIESIFKEKDGVRDYWALAPSFTAAIPRDPLSYQYGIKPSSGKGVHAMLHTGGMIVSS